MSSLHRPDGAGPRHFGLYPALVTDVVDPDALGRVQVRLPWLGDDGDGVRVWARLLSPYAEDDQGFFALPEVDTEVAVAFEAGDLRRPYVVGAVWNGVEAMPERPTAANDKRVLQTRSGSRLEFDDAPGAPKITLSTPSGHEVVLDDGGGEITVRHSGGATIVLDRGGAITLQATSTVEVHAAVMNVHTAAANFDGIVTCTTLIASSGVVSPSYTPGAGNIW